MGRRHQISPNLRVLTGLRPPSVTLSLRCRITCSSVAANISALQRRGRGGGGRSSKPQRCGRPCTVSPTETELSFVAKHEFHRHVEVEVEVTRGLYRVGFLRRAVAPSPRRGCPFAPVARRCVSPRRPRSAPGRACTHRPTWPPLAAAGGPPPRPRALACARPLPGRPLRSLSQACD